MIWIECIHWIFHKKVFAKSYFQEYTPTLFQGVEKESELKFWWEWPGISGRITMDIVICYHNICMKIDLIMNTCITIYFKTIFELSNGVEACPKLSLFTNLCQIPITASNQTSPCLFTQDFLLLSLHLTPTTIGAAVARVARPEPNQHLGIHHGTCPILCSEVLVLGREVTLGLAFVTTRLDYCNSVLAGLPQASIDPLKRVQNAAARLVAGIGTWDHITPVLRSLHWLPN